MSRDRVENRAHLIYEYLTLHLGEGFTIIELSDALGFRPGSTTTAAINRARDLATEAGLHFPPAVPANGQRYMITKLAMDALDPTLHMERIRAGVERRANVGREFMKRERQALPPEYKPVITAYLEIKDQYEKSSAAIQRAFEDMVVATVNARREARNGQS